MNLATSKTKITRDGRGCGMNGLATYARPSNLIHVYSLVKGGREMFAVQEPLVRLTYLTQKELCEVYQNVNTWNWDERLGEAPKEFNGLRMYNRKWYHKLLKSKTKYYYTHPICEAIREIVSEKELLRYHHIYNLHATEEEFNQWWKKDQIEKKTGMFLY